MFILNCVFINQGGRNTINYLEEPKICSEFKLMHRPDDNFSVFFQSIFSSNTVTHVDVDPEVVLALHHLQAGFGVTRCLDLSFF